jgi:hypothetical protein
VWFGTLATWLMAFAAWAELSFAAKTSPKQKANAPMRQSYHDLIDWQMWRTNAEIQPKNLCIL